MLRLRALLRRTGVTTVDSGAQLVVGDLVLDEDSHEVMRAGEPVSLTSTEFELLRFMMHNSKRVLSKAQILDRVWSYDFGGRSNIVELYISYLRKKIDNGRRPMIHTLRGARLCAQAGPLAVREFGRFGCGSWSDRLSSSPWCVWESPRQPKWRCVVIWWHNLTTNSAERRTARC